MKALKFEIKMVFTKNEILKLNRLLEYISENGSVIYIDHMKLNITFNFYGGYYNLFIKVIGKKYYKQLMYLLKEWNLLEKGESENVK